MRCPSFPIQLILILVLAGSAHGQGPDDPGKDRYHSGQADYMIGRYVFASGGVSGAFNAHYVHRATAGETFVGGMEKADILLESGFWHPVRTGTGVDRPEDVRLPELFELYQNSPNPFNPRTTIRYDLPRACAVTVEIFNVVGQRIRLLSDSQIQGPGTSRVVWDGRDDLGKVMGSGVYLYRVTASAVHVGGHETDPPFQQTRKMVLVK